MKDTIPLGRIAGVRVGLHWSVIGIVVLVAAGLAAYQLPAVFPGHSQFAYVLAGISGAACLVLSLLGHEVAHAVVAMRNGVAVEGITLWLLGGVARLTGEAESPGIELRIAVIGPATSGLLAGMFGVLGLLAAEAGMNELAVAVLVYLALLNAVLAVFNLVPAAPLDGGRVLRAALWWWRGDRFKAAVWSAWAGRGFGFLLVAAGFVLLLRGTQGLWWVLLGWFIVSMASAEEQHARLGAALAGMRVRDVMSSPVETADGRMTVEQFFNDAAFSRAHSAFPVFSEDGAFAGLVTFARIKSVPRERRAATTLREVACPASRVAVADPDEMLAATLPRLTGDSGGRLLVFQARKLVGIVSPSDISRVVADHGLRTALPGGADLSWSPSAPPPRDWWYPGQQRPE